MKKVFAVHYHPSVKLEGGKFVRYTKLRDVRIMAEAEGYSMVRVKGEMPYACLSKELEKAG